MAIAFRAAANRNATTNAPKIIIPVGCQTGDVVIIQLSQNNTDAVTADPAGLVALSIDSTVSSFPNRLYYGIVDGVTINPGDTLTWTLSATRAWATNLYAASGVHTVSPIHNLWEAESLATTMVMPSGASTATSWLLEIGSGKSNGTSITTWTAPSGWTVQSIAAAISTFAGSSFIADNNAGAQPAGAYGGDTYTPDAAPAATARYLVALTSATIPLAWSKPTP